jgi:hypothetical protein
MFPDGNIHCAIEVGGHTIYGIIYDPLDTPAHAHIHSDEWKIRFQIPNDWPRTLPSKQRYGGENKKTYILDVVFEGNQEAFNRDLTYFKMMSF